MRGKVVVKQLHPGLGRDMLPGIGRPEAARAEHADTRHTAAQLVGFGRDFDQVIIGGDGLHPVDRAAQHLFHDRIADVDHLDVAVERNADHLAAEIAIVQPVGVVEVIERQLPLDGIFVQGRKEAWTGKVTEPSREELQRIERGIARDEFGNRLVIEAVIRDRHQFDLDARQRLERLQAFGSAVGISGADGKADGLAGLFAADLFPIDRADPVFRRIPQRIVGHAVKLAVILADIARDRDFIQNRLDVRQTGTGQRRHCQTNRGGCQTESCAGAQERPAGQPLQRCVHT